MNLTNIYSEGTNSRIELGIQDSNMLDITREMRSHRNVGGSAHHNTFDKTERIGRTAERNVSKKFKSPERNQFRYNMIYNKMNNMMNDPRFLRKGND